MIDSVSALHQLVSGVTTGDISLMVLDSEIARLGEHFLDIRDDSLVAEYGKLELLLAEYTNGHLDSSELTAELRVFAPVNVRFAEGTLVRPATFATANTFTTSSSRIIRQWIGGATVPSLDVGTRRAAARA